MTDTLPTDAVIRAAWQRHDRLQAMCIAAHSRAVLHRLRGHEVDEETAAVMEALADEIQQLIGGWRE